MGYGKRLTFASDKHNTNDNYFWSDTHPEGYGFALRLVQEGDKFTLRDANGYSVATAEVIGLLVSRFTQKGAGDYGTVRYIRLK